MSGIKQKAGGRGPSRPPNPAWPHPTPMFKLGKPETPFQWIAHVLLGIVALFLVWFMIRAYVL